MPIRPVAKPPLDADLKTNEGRSLMGRWYEELLNAVRYTATAIGPSDTTGMQNVIQVVNVMDGEVATGTTVVILDDSIPQSAEGDEYMSLAITPTNSSNLLKVEVICNVSHSSSNASGIVAIFQDAIISSLTAQAFRNTSTGGNTQVIPVPLLYNMVAGTTSPITFKIRAGFIGAGTTTFNGFSGARKLGGALNSSITITEYKV